MLKAFATYLVYDLFGMAQGTWLSGALEFFIYNAIKIFLPLSVITFAVSIGRSCFPPEQAKRILSHKREFIDNILAALLGIVGDHRGRLFVQRDPAGETGGYENSCH